MVEMKHDSGRLSFNGMPVMTSLLLTVPFEDWSEVRSKSRARRRMKRGYKQNVRHLQLPDPNVFVINNTIHGHPETIRALLAAASKAGA